MPLIQDLVIDEPCYAERLWWLWGKRQAGLARSRTPSTCTMDGAVCGPCARAKGCVKTLHVAQRHHSTRASFTVKRMREKVLASSVSLFKINPWLAVARSLDSDDTSS